jgi:hypothetical protein
VSQKKPNIPRDIDAGRMPTSMTPLSGMSGPLTPRGRVAPASDGRVPVSMTPLDGEEFGRKPLGMTPVQPNQGTPPPAPKVHSPTALPTAENKK